MDITLPDTLRIGNGKIQFNITDPYTNIFQINNTDYIPYYLDNNNPGNKGGNSHILKLVNAQEFDEDEGYPEIPDLILKISKIWIDKYSEKPKSLRFKREIDALIDCNENNLSNVVTVENSGKASILNDLGFRKNHRYYTMPYAMNDLPSFLADNNISLIDRVGLCLEICESLKQIWTKGYYHRDIKPDNILFIDGYWVISDLGLNKNRNEDVRLDLDKLGQWIGPRGWMSPEAMNKFLSEKFPWKSIHDCNIDHQSDLYQLGKVFWYIFQGNSPEGGIRRSDFLWKNEALYQIIRTMINNSKNRRYNEITNVIIDFKRVYSKLENNVLEESLY